MEKIVDKVFFVVTLACITLSSCSVEYGLGNNGINPIVFTKPMSSDSLQISSYIGGNFNHSIDSAYSHRGETNYYGQLYYFRTHTSQYYSFSYGAFGYVGKYNVVKIDPLKGTKNYVGGGLSGEFVLNLPFENVDFRILGLKASILYEDGNFAKFRRDASALNLIDNTAMSPFLLSYSGLMGVDIRLRKKSVIGLEVSSGFNHNMIGDRNMAINSLNIHFTKDRFTILGSINSSLSFILPTKHSDEIEYSFGLNYRIF